MNGAAALGGFVSLTDAESFARRVLAARALQAVARAAAARVRGHGRADHRRRRRDRRLDRARADRPRRLRRRHRHRPRPRPACVAESLGDTAIALQHGRDRRALGRGVVPRSPRSPSAASTSSSRTRASPRARRSRRRRSSSGSSNHAVLTRGYFLIAREAAPPAADAGHRRQHRLHRLEERARARQGRVGLLVGEGRRAAPRALPRRGARARDGIRVNIVNPDAVLEGSRIWDSAWREERARGLRDRARRARGPLPRAHDAEGERRCPPTSPRRCCSSPRRSGPGRAPATC